jgi:protein-glucosylgalactosylhydroxylysine glucosidase
MPEPDRRFALKSRMSGPLSPSLIRGPTYGDLPAYLANGVVGLRVRDNPLASGMAMLCGYTGLHPERKIEAEAAAPYPLAGNLALNDVWLSDVPHQLIPIDQAYDFSNGELVTHIRFSVGGVTAQIEVLTFCCRHQPTLVAQEIAVTAHQTCDLKIQALIDTTGINGRLKARTLETPGGGQDFDGSMQWEAEGGYSCCGVALVTQLVGDRNAKRDASGGGDRNPLAVQYGLRAQAGKIYRLRQIASLVPSVMHSQPDRQAERLAALGRHQTFKHLRKANRAEWAELWKGRIMLHGAGREWQQLADAAFYYTNASAHAASPASTSMFGLAAWHDYHYYFGHVMWDIETFSVPPLTLLQPEAAEALLEYRLRGLSCARSNAQCFGRRGLQFPWESGPSTGEEVAPSPGTAAWHEDHVSLDVALAFARYAQTTGDGNFLRDKAWPVLSGVADWIASRAHRGRKGWEIRRSMGIAERKQECDNEAFTMLSAGAVLGAALDAAKILRRPEGSQWREIATRLKLPLRDGVLISHDGYRSNEEKGATPSPLMGIFPLENLDGEVARATLNFYLERSRGYIGSPMLSALYGVWAARKGDRKLALKLLDEGYARFTTGRFLQTLEYRPDTFPEQPKAGPFFANMGGFLMSLLLGFPRLKPLWCDASKWPQNDVVLPASWQAIEVERLWLKGRPMHLFAEHGRRTRISAG